MKKQLNLDIKDFFPHIKEIEKNYSLSLSKVQRLVMLDRYSQKDVKLITLKKNDLVLVAFNTKSKFQIRIIGNVVKIHGLNVEVEVEKEYLETLSKEIKIYEKNKIIVEKSSISKPIEIYWEQIAWRVCNNLSKVENSIEKQKQLFNESYEQIKNMKFLPAGRILFGAGSKINVTYFNCFVLPFIPDSRGGIADHRKIVMEIMSRGGGVGTNGSTLRPRYEIAKQVQGSSSGAVSWLNDIANLTHLVEQGGSRRGAQMIMLADWHPDIIEFIISKMQNPLILHYIWKNFKDPKIKNEAFKKLKWNSLSKEEKFYSEYILNNRIKFTKEEIKEAEIKLKNNGTWRVIDPNFLTGANISITISDKFMQAVKKNQNWELKFPDINFYNESQKLWYDDHWHKYGDVNQWKLLGFKIKTYYTVSAVELWNLINFCATYSAEPGVFFIDTANRLTNAQSYGQKIVATNPCAEQPLCAYSVCNLGAINLSKFFNKNTMQIDYDEIKKTTKCAIQLQDNVIDKSYYFLKENKEQSLGERRIGLGVMGLHSLLILANIKYGSKESIKVINKIFKTICLTAYETSIKLAKEKGSFSFLDDREKFVMNGFCATLPSDIKRNILQHGIRNSHLLTIAPTGTTSTLANVSNGLEPYFAFNYFRSGRLGKNMEITSPIIDEYFKIYNLKQSEKLPEVFVKAMDLTPSEHVNVQVTIQKWIDSSISKTVNAPSSFTVKDVEVTYMQLYDQNAKGGTIYVDGSRNAQVLSLKKDKNKKEIKSELIDKNLTDEIASIQEKSETKEYRKDILGRNIGNKVGDICAICIEGTLVFQNGCATCNNCSAQLKCNL